MGNVGLMSRVFASCPGFNPKSSHTEDSKKDKVEQSRERSSALP